MGFSLILSSTDCYSRLFYMEFNSFLKIYSSPGPTFHAILFYNWKYVTVLDVPVQHSSITLIVIVRKYSPVTLLLRLASFLCHLLHWSMTPMALCGIVEVSRFRQCLVQLAATTTHLKGLVVEAIGFETAQKRVEHKTKACSPDTSDPWYGHFHSFQYGSDVFWLPASFLTFSHIYMPTTLSGFIKVYDLFFNWSKEYRSASAQLVVAAIQLNEVWLSLPFGIIELAHRQLCFW